MAGQETGTGAPTAGEDAGLTMDGYTPGWAFETAPIPPEPRKLGIIGRVRAWLGMRSLTLSPMGTSAIPVGQHEQLSEAEAFRREHGYSAGFEPEQATPEIAAHNRAISAEYDEEIDRRFKAMKAGEYRPRFLSPQLTPKQMLSLLAVENDVKRHALEREMLIARGATIGAAPSLAGFEEVNWHLEMTTLPGRRTDVTTGTGLPFLTPATPEALAQANEIRALKARVAEREALGRERTVRDIIGSRESILAVVGGNESMADAVEANAKRTFGVDDLDQVPARL